MSMIDFTYRDDLPATELSERARGALGEHQAKLAQAVAVPQA